MNLGQEGQQRGGCGFWVLKDVCHCFPLPILNIGLQTAEQRSRRPFLALSTGSITSIYVLLCPLPSYIRCRNTETEKLGPWIFRKLWVAWLHDGFGWCGFVYWVPFLPALLVVTVAAILLFCLLKFFVVSGCLFPSAQDLIQEINELRLRVGEMDNERLQYEKKLKTTKVSEAEGKRQR